MGRRGSLTTNYLRHKSLEYFHMKCQRHILGIRWYNCIRSIKISWAYEAAATGAYKSVCLPSPTLSSIKYQASTMDLITRRRSSLFAHVARLGKDTPAHRQLDMSLGRLPNRTWKRPRVANRCKWLDQIRSDNNLPPVDQRRWLCYPSRLFWGNATVPADYAMTTTI